MKIAFTADIHLRTMKEYPERYNALKKILEELKQSGITYLIIAGDAFDKDAYNYNDFDNLCSQFNNVKVILIPGNHDPLIEKRYFIQENIEVITTPTIKSFDEVDILFIPYIKEKSMDEVITEFYKYTPLPNRWILVGHGDYITTRREINTYEEGLYMPLSSKIIDKYNPLKVILGHIHKFSNFGRVIYPGSPCGINITETGRRKFIIYDTQHDEVEPVYIQTDIIFYNETLLTYPVEDELELIKKSIDGVINRWELTSDEITRVKIRLEVRGYTTDISNLKDSIISYFKNKGIVFYEPDGLNLSNVKVIKEIDEVRIALYSKVKEKVEELGSYFFEENKVNKENILEKALEIIWGE